MLAPRRPWRAGALAAVLLLAAATLLIATGVVPLAGPPPGSPAATESRIDAIFAPWAGSDGPGCAVSVMESGDIVFANGYGVANLEYDIPITPASVFHVASVSKQFTALAVALLADEGRLAWDDDIRRHVPELPDFGVPITLRHLAQHTSGIRDQWSLLQMAGWRWGGDVITQGDVLDLLTRQAALHFRPGTEHLYSNSGYTLLAVAVERVSGQTLRAFTDERIFGPLGMARTTFRDDHTLLVRDRAYAYEADGAGGYRLSIPDFAVVGASSLFTTVEDLARWNRNFRTGEVGGRDAVRQIQETTTLAGGAQVSYAYGLVHGTHRGRRTVGHGGTDAGYRSEFLRFPEEDLAVAVLCNVRTTDPARLARDVADAVLPARPAGRQGPAGRSDRREGPGSLRERSALRRRVAADADARPETDAGTAAHANAAGGLPPSAPTREELTPLAGYYTSAESDIPLHLVLRGNNLVLLAGGRGQRLLPLGNSRYRLDGTTIEVELSPGQAAPGSARGSGRAGVGRPEGGPSLRLGGWRPQVYHHAAAARPSADRLAEYAGAYHSADLDIVYRLRAEDSRLTLRHRKLGVIRLTPTFADGFYGGGWYLTFGRDPGGGVTGFTMSSPRARKVPFRRQRALPAPAETVEPWPGACSEPAPPAGCTLDRP
ncbi:MAG: serine hydrolase [Acidobacteria bacterium]|nr:serine hydrolase [Acidobacteriota bacterium]